MLCYVRYVATVLFYIVQCCIVKLLLFCCDVYHRRLGLNSIFIYLLSCTGITEIVLTCFYWNETDQNLSHLFFPTGMGSYETD